VRQTSIAPATLTWWKRENLVSGFSLLLVTALAWGYTLQASSMDGMPMPGMALMTADMELAGDAHGGMEMPVGAEPGGIMESTPTRVQPAGLVMFLFGWSVMMVAMMLPAALPLILLYGTLTRKRPHPWQAALGMGALLTGYIVVWAVAGLPVYGYSQLAAAGGPPMAVLPGLLLVMGGVYQFTGLKHGCHTRCSSPLFFLTRQWRPGVSGAARLGVLHGIDCLGCCVGLMLALVALGMMNVAWMLTAAVIIFVEKTLPSGHRVARPLGTALVLGGVFVLATSLLSGRAVM
jgi:predicted metal-binding membrane protein